MKVFITGSSGFVGTNLKLYLTSDKFGIKNYIRDKSINLDGVHSVVHLAGKAHDLKNVSRPEDYYSANFELTKKMYDEFLKSDTKKFIFISSVKAIADKVDGVLTESDKPNPQTHYGKSKLQAEEYIIAQPLPEGKSFFILRPCMIHGPGNKGNLNLLYKLVSKGIPWPLASFENKRSFLSIENLSFVIKELIERDDISSGVFNIADDDALSTNDLINIISTSLNLKSRLMHINSKLINSIARLGDVLHLPLNSERLQKLTESYVVSNQKIKIALGKQLPIKAKDGLTYTIQSFNKI